MLNHFFIKTFSCYFLGGLLSLLAYAELYKWTDKQGHVHYSDVAPKEDTVRRQKSVL